MFLLINIKKPFNYYRKTYDSLFYDMESNYFNFFVRKGRKNMYKNV